MRASNADHAAPRRFALLSLFALVSLFAFGAVALAPSAAFAQDRATQFEYSDPTYGVRVYEVFQRGPKIVLEERTTRAFEPHHVRNIGLGEVYPPEGMAPIKIFKSRDHLEFVGSYWREDGVNDYGKYEVEVWEVEEADEPGIAYVRVRIVERSEMGMSPKRRVLHPEHDDHQRQRHGQ